MKLTKKVELKSLHKKKEPWKEQVQNLIIKVQSMIHEKKKRIRLQAWKIFPNPVYNKGLLVKIYKEL